MHTRRNSEWSRKTKQQKVKVQDREPEKIEPKMNVNVDENMKERSPEHINQDQEQTSSPTQKSKLALNHPAGSSGQTAEFASSAFRPPSLKTIELDPLNGKNNTAALSLLPTTATAASAITAPAAAPAATSKHWLRNLQHSDFFRSTRFKSVAMGMAIVLIGGGVLTALKNDSRRQNSKVPQLIALESLIVAVGRPDSAYGSLPIQANEPEWRRVTKIQRDFLNRPRVDSRALAFTRLCAGALLADHGDQAGFDLLNDLKRTYPQSATLHTYTARALALNDRLDEAIEEIQKGTALDKRNDLTDSQCLYASIQGDWEKVLTLTNRSTSNSKWRIKALAKSGKLKDALALCYSRQREPIDTNTCSLNRSVVLSHHAEILLAMGDQSGARDKMRIVQGIADDALDQNEEHNEFAQSTVNTLLCDIASKSEHYEQALKFLERDSAKNESRTSFFDRGSSIYFVKKMFLLNKLARHRECIKFAADRTPNEILDLAPYYHCQLGAAHFGNKDYANALKCAEQSIRINPHYKPAVLLGKMAATKVEDKAKADRFEEQLKSVRFEHEFVNGV